ncbi:FAD-dependent oxidoreductase [Sulfidibacter corallicola]|uniref:FAD-dependent oxidoreductase n=1 Tax=Sulfidibacter corallicola TaxID=2818388 RepID=A0A8A4TG25_SULCO|nr:FAD-dependent oxidoreductase [Sulfidibacter corallicola]QTD47721.1 FAD-dependent oxidoreductase [Sulfidibacter corallicola]
MLYELSNLKLPVGASPQPLEDAVAGQIRVTADRIQRARITREALDARKKPHLFRVVTVEFRVDPPLPEPLPKNVRVQPVSRLDITRPAPLPLREPAVPGAGRRPVVVVGSGPAGLFAALALGEAGLPTILLERGKPVETRMRDIGQLRSHGDLDPESNVCFGEGGAGTYTDGKLYTRVKHSYVRWVYRRLVDFGAPERILVDAHPHLGTDKLVRLVKHLRLHLQERGVTVRFGALVSRLLVRDARVHGVRLADGEEIEADRVVLAIGHSARDTLANLLEDGVKMEPKSFAVGVRAEHPQELINLSQYGTASPPEDIGAAAYRLTHQVPDANLGRRGVYSFCMCPGGFIVPSPTEVAHMAINGMSNANRSAPYANSGIVVQVMPEDLARHGYAHHPLMGIRFQRDLEAAAFRSTDTAYGAPGMRIDDFVARRARGRMAGTHFRPKAEPHDLWELLPNWIAEPLSQGLKRFDRLIKGYAGAEGNLLAVESRTSAPIRIPRNEVFEAEGMAGLYPVGEGAGYAGGIVSAAVDGLRAAEHIIETWS